MSEPDDPSLPTADERPETISDILADRQRRLRELDERADKLIAEFLDAS